MAKKRKAPKNFEQPQTAKLSRFDVEERFNDSEDEFYVGREKILLDEDANSKRRRRIVEEEKHLQPSDEEVLAYADEEAQSDGEDDFEDAQAEQLQTGESQVDDEGSEEEYWGTNRADYYNADVIETEADAIEEENEARRLYEKQMKSMTEADFGFDENEWTQETYDARKPKSFSEKLPEAQVPANATDLQKLQILQSRYPELQPLATDFLRLQQLKDRLDEDASRTLKQIMQGREFDNGIPATTKRDALATYLAAITTYFLILSSRVSMERTLTINALPPVELHEHAVIQILARARESWDRVADQNVAVLKAIPDTAPHTSPLGGGSQKNGLGSVSKRKVTSGRSTVKSKNVNKQHKTQLGGRPLQDSAGSTNTAKASSLKKRKKQADTNGKVKAIDLNALMNAAAAEEVTSDSDYGDEQPLTEEQYAEKDRKRKSLRFYTSQIASKANRRGVASREAGGDDDLPYKERQRDRQERLMKAAEARGQEVADRLDGGLEGEDQDDVPNNRRPDQNDEYYDLLLDASLRKKADKKAKAEAYAAAAQEGAEVYEEESIGPDGKRAITYAIAKNKGLAPKRKKEVRNPRVKKRKKFDEKVKKLGSMRQVYKGGEGRGGYGGELTGIKTNVVKSVKL